MIGSSTKTRQKTELVQTPGGPPDRKTDRQTDRQSLVLCRLRDQGINGKELQGLEQL